MSRRVSQDIITGAITADVWPPVIAVDPGGTSTGICLRAGTEAVCATTYVRDEGEHKASDPAGFVRHAEGALEAAQSLVEASSLHLTRLARKRGVEPGGLRWAVEGLVAPAPHRAKGNRISFKASDFRTLGPAAVLLGLLVGRHPDAVIVPPAGRTGYGEATGWDNLGPARGDESPYPDGLRGLTPTGWPRYYGADGKPGQRSHQRSAWGIAGAAHLLAPEVAPAAPTSEPETYTPDREVVAPVVRALGMEARTWDQTAWDAVEQRVTAHAPHLGDQDVEWVSGWLRRNVLAKRREEVA